MIADINECNPNPCGRNALRCEDGINMGTCICEENYSGPDCNYCKYEGFILLNV